VTRSWKTLGLGGAALLAAALLGACSTVPKPASDATPPEAGRWTVFDGGGQVDITGNGSYAIHASNAITVWFHGHDSQGLHKVSLADSVGWSCVSGGLGQQVGPGLAVPDVATFSPDANNMVPVEGLRATTVSGPYTCSSGFAFAGGTAALVGTATNWSNQTTTNTLHVSIAP
jgi:hypothetical protein